MYIKRFTVSEEIKSGSFKGQVPIKKLNITALYDAGNKYPKKWIFDFMYLEDRRPCPGYECRIEDLYDAGQIIIEKRVSLKRALKMAFSNEFWVDCHPVLLIQPDNPYFYFSGDYLCSRHGWKSGVLPYIDESFVLDRHDVVAEALDYAKRTGAPLPNEDDIRYLNNLIDYCVLTDYYVELTRGEYDDTVSWITKCASFPQHIKYLTKM